MAELADSLAVTEDDRLDQAEGLVRSYCGWHIAPSRMDTYRVAGVRDRVVILPSLYVTSVVSVTADGTVLNADSYDCTEAGVLTLAGYSWACNVLEVVFTHGYDTAPAEVTAAVQSLAQRATDNPTGLKSWARGPFSESYSDSTAGSGDLSGLNRYKLPPRP